MCKNKWNNDNNIWKVFYLGHFYSILIFLKTKNWNRKILCLTYNFSMENFHYNYIDVNQNRNKKNLTIRFNFKAFQELQ